MDDVIDNDSLLLALRDARPDSGMQTVDLTSAPAQALLNGLLETARTSSRSRVAHRVAVASLAAAAVAAGAVGAMILAGGAHSKDEHDAARSHSATTGTSGSTLRLAGYSFTLPAGYRATAQRCGVRFAPPPDAISVRVTPPPVVGGQSYQQAASADGGCVDASLGTGYPSNARPVQLGSYSGFLWRTDGTIRGDLLTLYVVLPPSASASVGMDPGLNLYLNSTGLTETQLEEIAASGLTGER